MKPEKVRRPAILWCRWCGATFDRHAGKRECCGHPLLRLQLGRAVLPSDLMGSALALALWCALLWHACGGAA